MLEERTIYFCEGRVKVAKRAKNFIYDIFIDEQKVTELSMEMYPAEPDEETVFTTLREIGIYPEFI